MHHIVHADLTLKILPVVYIIVVMHKMQVMYA